MRTVIVLNNQSLWDIALQEYGTVEAVFELARANDMGVTDLLTAGQELVLPALEETHGRVSLPKPEVVGYYRKNKLHPVTGETNVVETEIPPVPPSGESCEWIILNN